MARLRLTGKELPDIAEILRRNPNVLKAHVVKDTLFLKSKEVETLVEELYHDAVEDVIDVLEQPFRLPTGTSLDAHPVVNIESMSSSKAVRLPLYRRLNREYRRRKKKTGTHNVFWFHTGWFSKEMRKLLDPFRSDDALKLTNVKFKSRLDTKGRQMKLDVDLLLPHTKSRLIKAMTIDPFFTGRYRRPSKPINTKGIGKNPLTRLQYLENKRPLIGKLIQAHGRQMRIQLRKLVLRGKM